MNKRHPILDYLSYISGFVISTAFVIIVIFLIYQFTLSGYEFGVGFASFEPAVDRDGQPINITLTIEENASVLEVGRILERSGLIGNAYIYMLERLLNGASQPFPGGTFTLNTGMDPNEITRTLRGIVPPDDIVITIREGWTVQNIADYLEYREIVTAEEFMYAAENHPFSFEFVRDIPMPEGRMNRLEGYLFPDTYRIAPHFTSTQIIYRMLARFDEIYDRELRQRTEDLGLTIDEVIKKASIIEMEIRIPHERELASAVIRNRLDAGMMLQMCSTVLYVLDVRRAWLLYSDLETESPYNTYLHHGLPIGPIANPGAASIRAALFPADVDYLFFVVRDEETGEHYFTNNYADHSRAQAEFNQRF